MCVSLCVSASQPASQSVSDSRALSSAVRWAAATADDAGEPSFNVLLIVTDKVSDETVSTRNF